jgi:hypothetical protein
LSAFGGRYLELDQIVSAFILSVKKDPSSFHICHNRITTDESASHSLFT